MQNPCNGCEGRTPICHSRCTRYKAYSEWLGKIRTARQREREANSVLYGRTSGLRIANYRKSYERM